MKYLLPSIAALGVAAAGAPARAQAQQSCEGAAVLHAADRPLTGGRHQVLAPRDSANLPSAVRARQIAARRVRMADGSVRVRRYVTKSGVPVTKQRPVACTPVPKVPGAAVGDVAPPAGAGGPGIPTAAPGEVIPAALPVVGSRFPFPLLGGLLLGGSAIAIGSHTPGSPAATSTTPTPTPPVGTTPGGTTPGGTTPGGTTPGGTTPGGTTPGGTTPTPTPSPTPPGGTTPTPSPTPTPPGTPGTPVPEPATVALVGAGLLLVGGLARRKR